MRTLTETFWLIDNVDVRTWYYRNAPAIGSTVRYTNETFIDTVARVTPIAIWLESGHMMRRPYLIGRLLSWVTAPHPRYRRTSTTRTVTQPQLRPDMTILAV